MHVLLAEDELGIAALLKRCLSEEGYAVDVTFNGADALRQALEFRYDALVLDVRLSGLDGRQVCRKLREQKSSVPVLMLTARDIISDTVPGLDAGADGYLIKPFSFDDLSTQLRSLIHRGPAARPRLLHVGDLRLDPATGRAWRGEVELELSTREFALMRLFMTHPGEALSRHQILEHVWDYTNPGSSNVVDQYVLYLRRKMDRPFGVRQLETVRGAGYRLREQPERTL
jgi:two-component system OmpR family response regulator